MFLRLNNLFVTVNQIHKKLRPSVRKQFVFIFYKFLPMLMLGFLKKVPGQSIFREATNISLVTVMFCNEISIADIFLHSFYIAVSNVFRVREEWCHGSTLGDPWRNQKQIQKKELFLEIVMFLG